MPLYDYACRDCGNSFEIRQSYQDEPLTECPSCHGAIRRVINQVGLVFKGGGYYITDTRPAGSEAGKGAGAATAKESGAEVGAGDAGTAAPAAADAGAPAAAGAEAKPAVEAAKPADVKPASD